MSRLESDSHGQSPVALLLRQMEGIDAWNRARQSRERALRSGPVSRQDRLEAARRIDMLAHAHATVLARASSDLAEQPKPLAGVISRRAVVAHRHRWFTDKLSQGLEAGGVEVIGVSDNAAEALGVVVAEQPDLLVLGDALMMLTAVELLSDIAQFATATLRAVQVSNGNGVGLMLDAGAHSVFTEQVSTQEMADHLLALLEVGHDRPAGACPERAHMMRAREGGESRDV
jgi:CheY-like chemotaxis protein